MTADGTGLKVWPTSVPLLSHLQQLISKRLPMERPLRVLELGSGCGLLGMGLAATCHAATPLQAAVIGTRIAELRELTATSQSLFCVSSVG